ncbi:MAG: sensor histidine kinase [Trueperaceae bacterium]|nr:sensor histidine kinase [Trueperaceae bacterium]
MKDFIKTFSPRRIGWQPYIYLIYLVFLFFQPFFNPDSRWWEFPVIGVLILLFIPLYFWTGSQRGSRGLLGLAAICLLGILGMQVNSGSTVFFIYAAALAGVVSHFRRAVQLLVAVEALVLLTSFFSPIPMPYRIWAFAPAFILVPMIGFLNLFEVEKSRSNAKLRMAQEELEHLATIAERERIARDLHDLLGHTLSMITLKSELAAKLIDKHPDKAKAEMTEVERISRETLSEVRSAVTGFRQKGFMAELASAKLALESAGVSFAFKGDVSLLNALQESTLSLVLREAVTNVIRHSGATRCFAELSSDDKSVQLEISDNGKGFAGTKGNGLSGIEERIRLLGGELELSGMKGMRLKISFPKEMRRLDLPVSTQLGLEAS